MDKQHRALRQSGVSLALLLGAGGLLLTGCHQGGGDAGTTTTPTTPTTPVTPRGPGTPPVGQATLPRTGPNGMANKGPGATPTAKADPFAAAAAPTPAGGFTALALPPKKYDPFYVTWKQAPPPPDPLASGDVQPIRVASVGYQPPPEQEVTVREVPDRRVSGIMSGDGVFAIIEQNGESEVVKPGGTTKDGYRVLAINEDSVKLQKKVGNLNYLQTVQLSDIQTGGPTQAYGQPGGMGRPGFGGPGFGQPGRGRPGAGRFGGAGGGGKSD